MMKSYVPILSS